jgi:hypothetical protein
VAFTAGTRTLIVGGVVSGTAVPVPVNVMLCGLPVALSVTTKLPVRVPVADGVNVTFVVQLAAGARVAPQVVVPFAKLVELVPPIAMLVMFSVLPPVLVRVTVCAALVVPIVVLPKTSGADSDAAAGTTGAVGVTEFDNAENAPWPNWLLAATLNW